MNWHKFGFGSGPNVARLFHKLLALVFLDAWVSLLLEWRVLIGARGLLPAQDLVDTLRDNHIGFAKVPSLFLLGAPDWALALGIWLGVALALAAFFGLRPRLLIGISTVLYLSYASIGGTFLMFQWDNLLLECGAFAVLLPDDRDAPVIHLLFRLILFKLYWESGLAKWQSVLRDWQDGSAMTFYYETAPLPTFVGWFAHHAPVWWHHLESWATLFFELVLPFAIFSPRRVRQFAAGFFCFFQVINAATANYGFFCYLACVLNLFLLDDVDLARFFKRPRLSPRPLGYSLPILIVFMTISLIEGVQTFTSHWRDVNQPWARFRLINTYHLFASITRERVEVEFQTTTDGTTWVTHDLYFKPGDVRRRPPFVAPRQPRVDFQLWFYALSFQRGPPEYVINLMDRLCSEPSVIQPLFRGALPEHPSAVRMSFARYHFSTAEERGRSGAWWSKETLGATRPIECGASP